MSTAQDALPLFERIASFPALLAAAQRAAQSKRDRPDAAAFFFHLETWLLRISDALYAGTWQPGPYRKVMLHEPKTRHISIAPFADRVVHQALHGALRPLLERSYITDTFASIPGRDQHRAIARYEQFAARQPWVLRCDIHRFFPSIDHAVAKACLRRHVRCPRSLALFDKVIDGSNPQEPVLRFYPGDDLFTPHQRRRGLPLGNLTSQMLGNLVLNPLDHFVKEVLRVKGYVRYLDDFALFCDSPAQGRAFQAEVGQFLDAQRLSLHATKTRVQQTSQVTLFLGLELHRHGHRRLPHVNVSRAVQRINQCRAGWLDGSLSEAQVRTRLNGWVAHARHADTFQLRQSLFPCGWFLPRAEPLRPRFA